MSKKLSENGEVVKLPSRIKKVEQTPQTLIALAIQQGTPVEGLEKLMDLQDRWDKKQAKIAFDEAMASFQGECPIIKKTKEVPTASGKIAYKYAPIDAIVSQVRSTIEKYGLSYAIQTETLEGKVKSTCIVKHKLGHSESSSMEIPLGQKTGVMSDSQVVAAALTFAKRYSFCNAFGIMTGDDDNEQMIQEQPVTKEKFVNYMDQLVHSLKKNGAKDIPTGIEVYNKLTGENIKELPKTNEDAKSCLDLLTNSPLYVS